MRAKFMNMMRLLWDSFYCIALYLVFEVAACRIMLCKSDY